MTKYTFHIENIIPKPGFSSGNYFDIKLKVDGEYKMGSLKGETWFQGCGLNALQGFSRIYHWPVECIPTLLKFLAKVRSSDPMDGTYTPRRYILSLAGSQLGYAFIEAIAAEAEKLSKFPNLAHGPEDIYLYLLTV